MSESNQLFFQWLKTKVWNEVGENYKPMGKSVDYFSIMHAAWHMPCI